MTYTPARTLIQSTKPAQTIKKILLGITLSVSCLNPTVALAQYGSEMQQLVQLHNSYKAQAENLELELGFYVLRNLQPTASLLVSGIGVAALFEENLDPTTKAALAFAGAASSSYCLDRANIAYCADVANTLTSYVTTLNSYNQKINSIAQRINRLQY